MGILDIQRRWGRFGGKKDGLDVESEDQLETNREVEGRGRLKRRSSLATSPTMAASVLDETSGACRSSKGGLVDAEHDEEKVLVAITEW